MNGLNFATRTPPVEVCGAYEGAELRSRMGSNDQDRIRIVERARAYLLENLLNAQTDVQLTETDALLEGGFIDSMGLVELISFIQDEFEIHVGNDDLTEENFATLARIASYVLSKRAAAARS